MRHQARADRSVMMALLCSGTVLVVPAAARAAWEFVPEIEIAADANDNPRLVPEETADERAATRLLTSVRLEFANFSPRGELTIAPAVRSDAYADAIDEPLESTDTFLRSRGEYRWEQVLAGYDVDLSRERILGTEFLNAGPIDLDVDDPAVVDSLLLGQNERRRRAVLAPYTEITLNERASLRLDTRLTDVGYDGDAITSRTDFQDTAFGMELGRELNERATLFGRLYGSRFEAEDNDNLTDTAGVALGFSRLLSDAWTFNASVGVEHSDFEFLDETATPVTGTDDNFTFALGFRKRIERSSVNIDVRRNVNPDSFGFLTARNELRTALRRQMSPTLNGGIAFRFIDAATLGGGGDLDRNYGRLELDLAWAIGRLWSFTTAYEYSRNAFEGPQDDADSNAVTVGFTYRGQTRR